VKNITLRPKPGNHYAREISRLQAWQTASPAVSLRPAELAPKLGTRL